MNIKRAKEEIKNTVRTYLAKDERGNYRIPEIRQRPLLLIGPPGIGKTQIMSQISRECGIGLVAYTITHHTRQSAIGLPFIESRQYAGQEYSVTEYTMSEIVASIYEKIEKTGLKEGILFIDEINCVSETLAPTMLQFLQCKTFGNHRIPSGWIIAAAGNPPEYNKSVREFDMATLDRIRRIDVEADLGVWKEYAAEVGIHPAIRSYLEAKPAYFYRLETTADGRIFATPRGWEDLSELIRVCEDLSVPVDSELVGQYIQHPKIAKDFAAYLELYRKYQTDYRIEDLLSGKGDPSLIRKAAQAPFDEKLSLVSLLLAHLTENFKETERQEDLLSCVLEELSAWKEDMAGAGEEGRPADLLEKRLELLEKKREGKKQAELLSREEDYLLQDAARLLDRFVQELKKKGTSGQEEAEGTVRELYSPEPEKLDELSEKALDHLEHAFDFLEEAYGDSQEMVVFLTGLNTGSACSRFLEENECERYYYYNRHLLLKDRDEELRQRIRERVQL